MDGFRGKEVCELQPKEPLEACLNIHSTEPYVGHTHTCMSFPHVLWSGRHPPPPTFTSLITLFTGNVRQASNKDITYGRSTPVSLELRIPQNIPELRANTVLTETN